MKDKVQPTVSIVLPCRNEGNHIEACVNSLLAQEPVTGGFELIVADGMSDDGTREILARLARENPALRVIDNPNRITPSGMNAGILQAKGKYIAIFGAHTEYAPGYLRACAELLDEHPEISCSGGPVVSRGRKIFGQAVAAAMSNPVGIGNAKHRHPDYEGYAEGACFPLFRRETFDDVGLYDESLVHNHDDELNFRVARKGGKVFISPRAHCTYYVRETPSRLWKQYFNYGRWRVAVLRKHRTPASLRQLAPVLFFSCLFFFTVISPLLPGRWLLSAAVLPTTYSAVLAGAALQTAMKQGVRVGLLFPVAAAILHLAYAAGFATGAAAAVKEIRFFSVIRGVFYGCRRKRAESP